MANEVFMKRMKELRQKKGISMEELATALNVSKSRVNMWENNGSVPRSDVLVKIAEYYNVPTDYLLGNNNTSESPTDAKLNALQRNLGKLNEEELKKAENVLKAVFSDIFNDEDDDDDSF